MAKQFTGTVLSAKMNKTVTVRVEWKIQHPQYRKVVTRRKKFLARYENMDLKEGDQVVIAETRPLAKNVHFAVVKTVGEKTK